MDKMVGASKSNEQEKSKSADGLGRVTGADRTKHDSIKRKFVPPKRSAQSGIKMSGARHQLTPMKSRSQVVKSGQWQSKLSPGHPVDRIRNGLPVGFRKMTKTNSSVKCTNVNKKVTAHDVKKGGARNLVKLEKQHEITTLVDNVKVMNLDDCEVTCNLPTKSGDSVCNNKISSSNLSNLRNKIGLSFSFRKASRTQSGSINRLCKEDRNRDEALELENVQCELKKAVNEIENKRCEIEALKMKINEYHDLNGDLETKVERLNDEIIALKNRSDYKLCTGMSDNQEILAPIVLNETFDDYSLFDQSQNVATLQDQLSKMQEHNVSTTEELHATIEELKDLRLKTHCLREENRSLVSEQRILCESLCQQSQKASQYEQQLQMLIQTSDCNENELQRKFVELFHDMEDEREKIVSEFCLLKSRHSDLEIELDYLQQSNTRYKEECNRWQTKYEKLKRMHSGYSMRLSSLTIADKENRSPLDSSESNALLSPNSRTFNEEIPETSKNENEEKLSVSVMEVLNSQQGSDLSQSEINQLLSEKETAVLECIYLKNQLEEEQNSWKLFQSDLLTAVRVADTYRQEAEMESKQLSEENEKLRAQMQYLRKDTERLRRSGFGLCSTAMPSLSSVKSMVRNLENRIREFDSSVSVSFNERSLSGKSTLTGSKPMLSTISEENKVDASKGAVSQTLLDKNVENESTMESTIDKTEVKRLVPSTITHSIGDSGDPLYELVRQGCGSRRNALLRWCQHRTTGYKGVEITNFSSSWADGLAFCALLNSFRPDLIHYEHLEVGNRNENVALIFSTCDLIGIDRSLITELDLISSDRPSWEKVMWLVNQIYCHFVTGDRRSSESHSEKAFSYCRQTQV